MNPSDVDKTQIFANRAKEMHASASQPFPPSPPEADIPAPPAIKPSVKTLTKEEKILLATGGILTLGLGTIVIAGINEGEPAAPASQLPDISTDSPSLNVPVIETEGDTPVAIPAAPPVENKPAAPVHQTPHHAPAHHASGNSHAMFRGTGRNWKWLPK